MQRRGVAPFLRGQKNCKDIRQSDITVRRSLLPFTLVLSLVTLLAFANSLVNVTNKKIQDEFRISKCKVASFNAAGVAPFIIAPLTYAGWCVTRLGYRASFIIGVFVQGLGALLFWPSCHYHSFVGICLSNFVIGSSSALMENAFAPYVAGCGPNQWQEIRLNISAGLDATVDIFGAVVAAYTIYAEPGEDMKKETGAPHLRMVQWTYLAVACFCFVLAFAYIFVPIPEIAEEDISNISSEPGVFDCAQKPFRKQYFLFLGTAICFVWIGGHGSLGSFFMQYVVEADSRLSNAQAAHRLAIYKALVAVGRFTAAVIMRWIKGRYILFVATLSSTVLFAGVVGARGPTGLTLLGAEYFVKASVGPLLSSLSLRGLGKHRRKGASLLVTSISSIAIFSPAFGAIADKKGIRVAIGLPTACSAMGLIFSVFVNLFLGKNLDAVSTEDAPLKNVGLNEDDVTTSAGGDAGSREASRGLRTEPNFDIKDAASRC